MTIAELKSKGCIVFECISGSHAQGLATAESDTDIRGVFVLPRNEFFGLNYTPQISDERNDTVYYELGRFVELLSKNNPNALELLCTPEECVRIRHKALDKLDPTLFVSLLCHQTFTGYASTQIGKARGLNKKMHNPMPEKRATVLEFCVVTKGHHTLKLSEFLAKNDWKASHCGLTKMSKMPDMYALFYNPELPLNGIIKEEESNDVCLSSIEKGEECVGYLYFNKSAYSKYCRAHREYWDWVEKRNESRYQATMTHGKNYDAKNMMHTIRLLRMAKEIGETGKLNVLRADREELLRIKNGMHSYKELIDMSQTLLSDIDFAFANSSLKEKPNAADVDELLSRLRAEFYTDSDLNT